MTMTIKTSPFKGRVLAMAAGAVLPLLLSVSALAEDADKKPSSAAAVAPEENYQIPRQNWTYGGLFGYFDEQQLRRGFKIYHEVCANCHNMRLLSYRNLGQPGGPHLSKEEVEALAAEVQVADGFNDQGEVNLRPGKPSDSFQWKFKNEKEAAAALGGAVPPDLSVMAKARTVEREFAWYAFPYMLLKDLATQYQEQGSDYLYALLTGYTDPPPGAKVADGLYYDKAFPGHQLAMPQPLTDAAVDYGDGTPNNLDQESRDVVAFLAWAAEPHLVERKKMGLWVLVYLGVLAVLLFISKKTLWRNVEH
jgi:ubiquinol-cytochrome c reductase cytochrome c1 subunit